MNERRQDFELLQRFTRLGEQSAFADVVRRHLDLVFGTALRKVEDPGAAQEVAQNVFTALARKTWRFARDDSLPAWLHRRRCSNPHPGCGAIWGDDDAKKPLPSWARP